MSRSGLGKAGLAALVVVGVTVLAKKVYDEVQKSKVGVGNDLEESQKQEQESYEHVIECVNE